MLDLVKSVIKTHIRGWFLFHLLVNLLTNSFCLPVIAKLSMDHLTQNKISYGILVYCGFIVCEILSDFHQRIYLRKYQRNFRLTVHAELEKRLVQMYAKLQWNQLRKLLGETDIVRVMDNLKWPLLIFLESLVTDIVRMFPLIGYSIWLLYISPLSVLLYCLTLSVVIRWYSEGQRIRNADKIEELWDRYSFFMNSQFTDIIHHNGKNTMSGMTECMIEMDKDRDDRKKDSEQYIEKINLTFGFTFVISLLYLIQFINTITISDVLMYIQYTLAIRGHMHQCNNIYKLYREVANEYAKFMSHIEKCNGRQKTPLIENFHRIDIDHLEYTYPVTSDHEIPFSLQLVDKVTFLAGQIIQLMGDSGNGKSTFMDLICGVIPFTEYRFTVAYDTIKNAYGFYAITKQRIYTEQHETVSWQSSIHEIVTGEQFDMVDDSVSIYLSKETKEDKVWSALMLAQCSDFVKRYKDEPGKLKWIYSRNLTLSGGQKGRILIARILYKIFTEQPKLVVLDEIDKAFQANLAVPIVEAIMKYCRDHGIICFMAAHSTEVKNLIYDQVLSFDKGRITVRAN